MTPRSTVPATEAGADFERWLLHRAYVGDIPHHELRLRILDIERQAAAAEQREARRYRRNWERVCEAFGVDPEADPGIFETIVRMKAAAAEQERAVIVVAQTMHDRCLDEWERKERARPGGQYTLHGVDAHHVAARAAIGDTAQEVGRG